MTTTTNDVILSTLPEGHVESGNGVEPPGQSEGSATPRADGGKDAWLFLAACTVVEALVWGFAFSFGVFQNYYASNEPFSSEATRIAIINTTATGIMYMGGLLLFPAYTLWPRLADRSKWAGLPLMAAGLIGASFANNVRDLILTQGVLFGIGGAVVYFPVLVFLDDWFIKRKGFAYGIMWAGAGASGVIIPFLIQALLERWGFRTALRAWAVGIVIISSPLIYFLRPRLPPRPQVSTPRRQGLRFLRAPIFWFLQMGLVMESLGYFIPSIYLPIFARDLGLSTSVGTLLVALVNMASVPGTVILGMLIDRFHVTTVVMLSTIGAVVSVFIFWGCSNALPLLITFSILYGVFAGGFVSTSAGTIKLVKTLDENTDVGMLIGLLSAGRGIGAVASGPLSEALLTSKPWQGEAGLGYGTGYGGLIVFTGITAALGGISFLGRQLNWV